MFTTADDMFATWDGPAPARVPEKKVKPQSAWERLVERASQTEDINDVALFVLQLASEVSEISANDARDRGKRAFGASWLPVDGRGGVCRTWSKAWPLLSDRGLLEFLGTEQNIDSANTGPSKRVNRYKITSAGRTALAAGRIPAKTVTKRRSYASIWAS